jgi:hypothetical protein
MVLRELRPERRLPGGARGRVQLRDGGIGRDRQNCEQYEKSTMCARFFEPSGVCGNGVLFSA